MLVAATLLAQLDLLESNRADNEAERDRLQAELHAHYQEFHVRAFKA
jgi:hypothetical protein